MPRFDNVSCSQCGQDFGPGDSGFSHCSDHRRTHIRVDDEELNSKRRFACGLGPELPEGDVYFFESEVGSHYRVDCPGCKPFARQLGTPISQLSGRPGHPGFERFCEIARSWGYD